MTKLLTTHDLINECAELFRAHDLVGSEKVVLNAKTCIPDVPMVPDAAATSRPEGMTTLTPRTDEVEQLAFLAAGEPRAIIGVITLARTLERELAEAKRQIDDLKREVNEASRSAAAEARWKARQGDDYGSY